MCEFSDSTPKCDLGSGIEADTRRGEQQGVGLLCAAHQPLKRACKTAGHCAEMSNGLRYPMHMCFASMPFSLSQTQHMASCRMQLDGLRNLKASLLWTKGKVEPYTRNVGKRDSCPACPIREDRAAMCRFAAPIDDGNRRCNRVCSARLCHGMRRG